MTPVPRLVRRFTVLILLAAVALAGAAAPVLAQGDAGGAAAGTRIVQVAAEETDCPDGEAPCWDIPLFGVKPGEHVKVDISFEGAAQPHDLTVKLASGNVAAPKPAAIGGTHTLEFEFPANAETVDFFCSVHPTTMTGRFAIPSAMAAAGGADHGVPGLGVNFLAYWVGLIAFALLFIVYGLTFFLFKYNETPATTDQWDRSDTAEGQRKFSAGTTSILALVIAAVVLGVVIYLARMS